MNKLFSCLLAVLFLPCGSSSAWWLKRPEKSPDLPFLHTQGTYIVDDTGHPVALRGVNIGSWLLIEPWMLQLDGQDGIESEKDIWDLMEKRFGPETKLDLIRTHRMNFFTEEDVRRIATLGLNCIRVPVWWRAVADPEYGGDFSWLDSCIQWCAKNHIYVILDLHGAPGGQSTESRIVGEHSQGALWTDARFRQETIMWWKQIAQRYADEPGVAGFDLLNEAYTVDQMDTLVGFYDELVNAIRSVDTRHILFIQDGLLGFDFLPKPQDMGWTNVVYSFHYYPKDTLAGINDPSSFFFRHAMAGLYDGVPVNVGEFNSMQLDRGGISAFQRSCEVFDYYGWSWNFWSYKVLNRNRDYNWGLYGDSAKSPPNLRHDSLEAIRSAFTSMRTEALNVNSALQAVLAQPSRWPEEDGDRLTLARSFLLPDQDTPLRMEWSGEVPNVSGWAAKDRVGWVLHTTESGVYEFGIRYANSSSDNRARIWIDGLAIAEVDLAAGKSWMVYRDQPLGNFLLAEGRHTIALEKADAEDSFIHLQNAWLRKANGPALSAQEKAIWLDAFSLPPLPPDNPIRIEWVRNPVPLGHWRSGTQVSWKVTLKKDGKFRGTLTYATPHDDTLFVVYMDRKPLFTSWLKKTGGWYDYAKLDMSLLDIPAGNHTIDVKWETAHSEGAGNLASICLKQE